MLSTECVRELEDLLAIVTQRLWNLKRLRWHVDAPPATSYRESLAHRFADHSRLAVRRLVLAPARGSGAERETALSASGPRVCHRRAQWKSPLSVGNGPGAT